MSAVERRIVHEALKDDPEVSTASEGTEPNRYVVVLPRRSPTSPDGRMDSWTAAAVLLDRWLDGRRRDAWPDRDSTTPPTRAASCSTTRFAACRSSSAETARSSTSARAAARRASRSPQRFRRAR